MLTIQEDLLSLSWQVAEFCQLLKAFHEHNAAHSNSASSTPAAADDSATQRMPLVNGYSAQDKCVADIAENINPDAFLQQLTKEFKSKVTGIDQAEPKSWFCGSSSHGDKATASAPGSLLYESNVQARTFVLHKLQQHEEWSKAATNSINMASAVKKRQAEQATLPKQKQKQTKGANDAAEQGVTSANLHPRAESGVAGVAGGIRPDTTTNVTVGVVGGDQDEQGANNGRNWTVDIQGATNWLWGGRRRSSDTGNAAATDSNTHPSSSAEASSKVMTNHQAQQNGVTKPGVTHTQDTGSVSVGCPFCVLDDNYPEAAAAHASGDATAFWGSGGYCSCECCSKCKSKGVSEQQTAVQIGSAGHTVRSSSSSTVQHDTSCSSYSCGSSSHPQSHYGDWAVETDCPFMWRRLVWQLLGRLKPYSQQFYRYKAHMCPHTDNNALWLAVMNSLSHNLINFKDPLDRQLTAQRDEVTPELLTCIKQYARALRQTFAEVSNMLYVSFLGC